LYFLLALKRSAECRAVYSSMGLAEAGREASLTGEGSAAMTNAGSLEIESRENVRLCSCWKDVNADELVNHVSSSSVCWGVFSPSHYAFETGLPKVQTIKLMQRDFSPLCLLKRVFQVCLLLSSSCLCFFFILLLLKPGYPNLIFSFFLFNDTSVVMLS